MPTVGSGKYTYTLTQDWAKLPPGETFAMVSAVATDSQDRVYGFQRKDPPIVIFDRNGNFLSSWGNGAFDFAHGISISNDIVYLTDRNNSVCLMYTLDGKPIQMLGRHGVIRIRDVSGQATWSPAPPDLLTTPLRWLLTRQATCMSPTGIATRGCIALHPMVISNSPGGSPARRPRISSTCLTVCWCMRGVSMCVTGRTTVSRSCSPEGQSHQLCGLTSSSLWACR